MTMKNREIAQKRSKKCIKNICNFFIYYISPVKQPKFENKSSVKLDYRDNISLENVFRERKASLVDRIETRAKLIHKKHYVETENEDFSFSKTNRSSKSHGKDKKLRVS